MATETSSPPLPPPPAEREPETERIVLYDVGWQVYETLLEAIGERNVRLTYNDGNLEIMTLSLPHENWKKVIGRLIETLSLEMNIPIRSVGSITCKRKDLDKGLEPDESYYIQHEAQMRGKEEFDIKRDPPPDLVVEIDISYRAIKREKIYAAMGVPEVWRFDRKGLQGLRLSTNRQYEPTPTSLAFPFLRLAHIQRFLIVDPAKDETTIMREFRDWVRTALPPRKEP